MDEWFLSLLSLLLSLVVVALAFLSFRIRNDLRVFREGWQKAVGDSFRQPEALFGLYLELGFRKSLPPTRGWAASPDILLQLTQHARETHPNVVVECGSGASTVVLARCAELNGGGHVYSL